MELALKDYVAASACVSGQYSPQRLEDHNALLEFFTANIRMIAVQR